MLNHKHNESSAYSKSPRMARKMDYPEKEYQSVIDRARLTLFNLTDIWKSKIDANKMNKSCESIAVNRKALDVLTVWTRHRRSPSMETGTSPKPTKKSLYIENSDGERWRVDNKTSMVKVSSHGKCKPKSRNHSDKGKHKPKYPIDLAKGSGIHQSARRRSYDAGLNHMSFDSKCDARHSNIRQSRLSWQSLTNDAYNLNSAQKSQVDPNQTANGATNPECMVKARPKFKKTNTCDDLYANTGNEKPIKVLKRQTSVLPIITINDCGAEHSQIDSHKKTDEKLIDKSGKPRKKLSFREPVVLNEKVKELREKHSAQNNSDTKKEETNTNEPFDQV